MLLFDIQEHILEKLNALVVVIDRNGGAAYVSRSASQLLGYAPEELRGEQWWQKTRFSKPEADSVKKKVLQLMDRNSGSIETFEHEFRTAYGGQKWIRWNVSIDEGEQIVGIGYDVTDRRQRERQLLDTNSRLQQQNKEIRDSILCASRIQQNSLQSTEYISRIFASHFVLYKPKDIVSGDFYFFHQDEENKYVLAVDCTGHGVPGALMSMMANSIIREVLLNKKVKAASQILYEMDRELLKCVSSYTGDAGSEGMDVAVISISRKSNRLHFAGAFRPLILVRGEQLVEMRGSRYPLGAYNEADKIFEEQVMILQPGDALYLFSDGYADQFGGGGNKKMNRRNFRDLLKLASGMEIAEQQSFLEYSFNNWKQEEEQTDDVLVIGIRV